MDEILRRHRLDLNTTAELAIYNAIQEVEKIAADKKLTDAVLKLNEARNLVADFIDEHPDVVEKEREEGLKYKQQYKLLLQAYKDGFDSATACVISANKVVQEREWQYY